MSGTTIRVHESVSLSVRHWTWLKTAVCQIVTVNVLVDMQCFHRGGNLCVTSISEESNLLNDLKIKKKKESTAKLTVIKSSLKRA